MERLRCDKGQEYTAHEYDETCLYLDISQEFAAVATL